MGAEDLKRLAELDTDALFAAVAGAGTHPRPGGPINDSCPGWGPTAPAGTPCAGA